jgi:hypothetical protein
MGDVAFTFTPEPSMATRVTILISDDGTSVVESSVLVSGTTPAPAPPVTPVEVQEPINVLKEEFLKAIKRNRKSAFEALGFERCSSVPAEAIQEKIDALRAVVKG